MAIRILFSGFIFILISCVDTNENVSIDDIIYEEVFYSAVDSITENIPGQSMTLVFHNFYPDKVRIMVIGQTIEENRKNNIANTKTALLEKLFDVLDDSVHLKIEEKLGGKYKFYHKISSIDNVDFNSSSYFGSINASRPVISDDNKNGCFYIALNCGNNCSKGYVVFFEFNDNVWQIKDLINIWG